MEIRFSHCLRAGCGRSLRAVESVRRGYGPRCYARVRRACNVLQQHPNRSANKAAQLLSTPGFIFRTTSTQSAGLYLVHSIDHPTTYQTSDRDCNCPAGEHGRLCYHQVAVAIIAA